MEHSIILTARNTRIRVDIDSTPWPRKRASQMAHEALQALGGGVAAAIEAAPHVGVERALVDVSPVLTSGDGAEPEPETPQAPQVGPRTWESAEGFVKAVELPEGVILVTLDDGFTPMTRISDHERKALVFLAEDPPPPESEIESGSVEIDFDLEVDEIRDRMMGAANAILEAVRLRGQ
jgi:hypothetical protein